MPRKLNADETQPESLTPEEREEKIQVAASRIRELRAQIAELSAKRKALNGQVTSIFRGLKKDTGIKRKNIETTLAIIELEDEERDDTISQIRECYNALGEGETVDFLDAMKPRGNGASEHEAGHA